MKTSLLLLVFIFSSISIFAQLVEINGIPMDTSYTPHSAWVKLKKYYPEVTPVFPELPASVNATYDIVYATLPKTKYGKRELKLDIFQPRVDGEYPALIMVFGGGWRSGNKAAQVPMAMQIAKNGYVTIPVEYRLSPEALYPEAVYDIKAAIRFVRANADKYQIDPERIAITGSSAGGQLAALVGMTADVKKFDGYSSEITQSVAVQAIIDMDGVLDFTDPNESAKDTDPNKKSAGAYWFGATYNEAPEKWVEASPMIYAGDNTPPMLFINSAQPRFHAGRDSVITVLDQYNIYTEVKTIPDSPHSFWQVHPWFDETVQYMTDFLDKILK
jgi:pectinesterase